MKFEFDLSFQAKILGFILKDPSGPSTLELLDQSYFDQLEHAVIFYGIKSFYGKFHRIPDETFLKEHIRALGNTQDFMDLTIEETDETYRIISNLFTTVVKHGDIVHEKVVKFVSYVRMREVLKQVNLKDFDSYPRFADKVSEILKIGEVPHRREHTHRLLGDSKKRQIDRVYRDDIVSTPFRQVNAMTNAGGYTKGSIIVVLDKPKNLKTAFLINWSKGNLRMKRNVLYIDLENGAGEILDRIDQSITGVTRRELISGVKNVQVDKMVSRYKRLGGEIFVRRLPAYVTVREIEKVMLEIYREHGVTITDLAVDYIGKMGALSRKIEDKDRISDAYIDVQNLALEYGLNHVITAHHITREGEKREGSKYKDLDIAKCIDIVRHAQVIFGLNRTPEEKEANILRAEVVAQRDGVPDAHALFLTDIERQQIKEMSHPQLRAYSKAVSSRGRENTDGDI